MVATGAWLGPAFAPTKDVGCRGRGPRSTRQASIPKYPLRRVSRPRGGTVRPRVGHCVEIGRARGKR